MAALRIALAQVDLLVGDIPGNTRRVLQLAAEARDRLGADLICFPELALTSYPPEDLLLRPELHRRVAAALALLRRELAGIHLLVGHPLAEDGRIYNACSLIRDGELIATYRKRHLPNYSVFDEKRYFVAGEAPPPVVDIAGVPVAFSICEDLWHPGTAAMAASGGAALLININASPYHEGKQALRREVLARNQAEAALPIVYVNLVGGQDELVFDGQSMVLAADGTLCHHAPAFEESLSVVEVAPGRPARVLPGTIAPVPEGEAEVYAALVLGVRDYARKNRFPGAVLGLSGGIDSALTLAVAVDALGAEALEALLMPSRYTAPMSLEDAAAEANALGVTHHTIPIESAFTAVRNELAPLFAGLPEDVTEENIQARCRGILLMAVSNKFGRLVLATGNKSELSVGYATLYGDMVGGFSPLKDVFKTEVYRLARYRNTLSPVIPERVLTRPPSAELRPGQTDQDSLPPYEVLDPILERYIEQDRSPREIAAEGFDPDTVVRVARMVDRAEYKRRQGAPGVRVSPRAFGRDRRYPITSGYDETQPWPADDGSCAT